MEARNWGHPGFNFPRPPMNFHGPMSNGNMAFHRMIEDFGMRPPDFPAYSRPHSYHDNDNEFDNDRDLRRNAFWGGSEQFEPTQSTWRPRQKRKMPSVLKQFPKQETQKGAARSPQNENFSEPAAKNPQQPATSEVTQQRKIRTPNGGMKKRQAAGETRDAEVPAQPHKKLMTDDPAENSGVDISAAFSCNLCQYKTRDEKEIQKHFYSYMHREILKHLYIFFPKQRVDFLHEYLLYKKRKLGILQRSSNLQTFKDALKGIGQEHFLHRVQATHCEACDVLISYDPELVKEHIQSDTHTQNCKLLLKNRKASSHAAAKELLMNAEVVQMLTKFNMKQNPFKDLAYSPQVGSTEVLVAEEDDIYDDTDDEDAIADAGDDPEVPANHNEGPAHGNKDSDKMFLPNKSEMIKPATSSMTLNTGGTDDDEEEEEEEAAEAP